MIDRRNGGEAQDRDAGEPAKVLVAGGTGVTGWLVQRASGVVSGIELAYTLQKKLDNGPEWHLPLRITAGHDEICRVFRKHDWVVNCISPFEMHADSLARACTDLDIGYIDVDDSIDIHHAIMTLDGNARREGVPVLTGLGLCPDLSTALLILGTYVVGVEEVRDMRIGLRIGADRESGAASVEPMFRAIRGGYHAMLGGAIVEVWRNPVLSQNGIGHECPDADVVHEVCPSIRGYSYRVVSDALLNESVEKVCTSRLYAIPVVSGLFARFGATVTSRKARTEDTLQPAELVIALSPASTGGAGPSAKTTAARATGPGPYKMTATIAATTVVAVAGKPVAPGCRDLVGHPRFLELALALARDAGAHIEVPHDSPATGLLPTAAHCDTREKGKR